MTTTEPTTADAARMTRAQRAALPLSTDVAQALAEQHGVCIRPLAMRRIDTRTGRVDMVPVACGSTREDQCRPCAEKARRLRMVQCREGWHLDAEPVTERATPSDEHKELLAARADLFAAYAQCRAAGDEDSCEQIAESVTELNAQLRAAGVRAGSRRWTHQPNPSSVRPGAAKTPRTCPADPWPGARWGGVRRPLPALDLPDPDPRFLRPG